MGSNCCKGDAAGKPVARSNSSIYTRTRAGATLDGRFNTSVEAGGVRLTVSAAQTGDSGVYTLQASNAAGKDSTRVLLEVSPEEMPTGDDPPTFLRRLQDLTVKVGTRTRFLVEIVSSTECKVTWYRNERRLLEAERIALVRDGNFWCADVATVSVDDSGRWTCTAENLGGRASCSAHLNVLVPKAYKRPEFVEELRAILTEQGTVSLECKVVGVPTPVLRWFKDSREIKAGDVFALTANADDPTSLGTYTCEAINCMGRAYSSSKVHVIGRSKEGSDRLISGGMTPDPPPIFTKELEEQFVRICESLTLSCHIVVPPWPRNVVWYNKEGKIEPSTKYHVLEDGVGGYMVEVSRAEWADEGEWKCVATSAGGRVGISSCSVTMDVPKNYRKPRFMENLQAVLTEEGLVSFECKVVGFPTPVLSWFKDGQELKPGDVYQLTGTNSLGSYCCIARNCMGQASSSAELTVEDIQNQLNEEEKLQLFSKNQAPKFLQGLKSVEVKIDEPFRFTIKVAIPPDPTVLWYRDDQPVDESPRCHLGREDRGVFYLDIKNLDLMDQTEWKCVAMNDFGHSVTSCFLKLIVPRHFKKPRFLENLQAILSDEGAVNLECKVIGVPQPVLKWYKDGEELKPGDIHRIISGQDGTCCLGTYTCEAQNCMGIAASSASLLGFEDTVKAKKKKAEEQTLQRNLSLSTIHEERTSQMYDTPIADVTLDDKGEISFSFDGKEVSVSLYETPDLTEEEALQIVEMYADQLSENVTEHNVIELPPLRFVKETSTSGNLLMEAIIIDVSPDYFASPEEDLRTEADIEDISIADENIHAQMSFDQEIGEDYIEKTMSLLSDEKADIPSKVPRRKSDSQKSGEDYFSLSKDLSLSEEKKDDDTHILSESVSFASARSAGKQKSKPSQEDELGTQESSDITKTVLLREERRLSLDIDNKVKCNLENSSKRDSLKSSKDINLQAVQLPIDPVIIKTLNQDMLFISSLLFKVINDIQVMERDIILKSQLMSSAAIASKSLEIINSLITPLSEIHSIADTVRETINTSSEISNQLFTKLPYSLKELQKSLIIVEKCIDVGSDKTLIKNTCMSIINNCEEDITNVVTKINNVTVADHSFIDSTIISEVQSLTREILNIIQISKSTVATKSILNQEIKKEEVSVDIQHLNNTQKAIYDLKIPLHSLLSIIENALKENTVSSININSAEVLLINMSASIQDLQTALEHIEFLSVEESNSSLQKYNTNIIETVMGSVLKLRSSFENLSLEKNQRDATEKLQDVLRVINVNLNEISSHIGNIESTIGVFDVLHGDNKLEVLQKMAHILISLENNLPILSSLTNVQSTLTTFHKNLTKALEHVIECNDSTKYLTLVRICDVVTRINVSIKSISSTKLLSLASIGNNFSIIEEILKNNSIDQGLNQDILKCINQYFIDIQNIMIYIEDESIRIDSEHVHDISIDLYYNESKANIVIHQIDQVIDVINNIPAEEVISNLSAVVPVLQNICPVLEELKYNVASLKHITQENESQSSDMSVSSLAQSFGKPLRELHENIIVINQLILESVGEEKFKDELTAVFAKPLHELYTTLQTLQENIISQYDNLSSMHASGKIATAVQILQNFVLLVQEQPEIEPIEEISTLDDISCIKTTADSISSDHLMLPLVEVTTVEQAPTSFRIVDQQPEVPNVFQLLHNDIIEIQNLDILDALNALSEVKEYADLKFASKTIGELQNKITGILSPLLMESLSSVSSLDMASANVTTVSETLLKLKNHLSIIDVINIPTYENVLQIPSDKIHLIVKNISNLKVHLDQCLSAVDQTSYVNPELSKEIDNLCKVCEDLKSSITDAMQKEVKTKLSLDFIRGLENSIESFLQVMEITSNKNIEIIKGVCEKFYKEILKMQDEVVQYVNLPGDVYVEDDQLVAKINIIANKIAVLEQYNIIDISNILDMDDFIKPMYNITSEAIFFISMEDLVKSKVTVINDFLQHTSHTSDIERVEEFFTTCKSSFFIMRTLLCQQPTRKKLIRLLHEYFRLQIKISDFFKQRSTLDISPEVQLYLDNFFSEAEDNLEKIKTSMLKVYSSLSTSLFKRPLEKIEDSIEYLPKYLKLDNMLDLHGLIQNFLIILNIAYPHLKNLENAVNNELQSCVFIDSYVEDSLIIDSLENFITLLENEINTNTERKILLTDIVKCFESHKDFKNALGTSKKMIILKCLADCTDLLWKQILDTEKEVELLIDHKSLQTVLHKLVESLKLLNGEIKKIQNEDLCGFVQSKQLKMIESYAQNISLIKQAIQKHVEFQKIQFHENDISLAKAVIQEIHSIQENLHAVKNVTEIHLSDTETYLKEIEIFLSKTLFIGKTSSEDKLSQNEIESFLQHVEQYIELTENIKEISAVVNVQNIQKVKKITQELRKSITNSEINPGDGMEKVKYYKVPEYQDDLVQCLQNSLADIHNQSLDKTYVLISTDNSVQQHSIEIINQLQDDLNKITSTEVPKIDIVGKCSDDDSEIKIIHGNIEESLHCIENISSETIKLKDQYVATGCEHNVQNLQDDSFENIEINVTSIKTEPFSESDNPNLIMETDTDDNNKQINSPDLRTCTERMEDTKLLSPDLESNKHVSQIIATDGKMYSEESKVQDFSTDIHQRDDNAVVVIHQIENTILSIHNIDVEEIPSNINNIYPVLENICPILEELKFNIASLQQFELVTESHTSDISDNSAEQTFGKPLRELEKYVSVLNQLLLESVKDDVEYEHIQEVFAKPLHELYCTYQTLQENVISQYESFSSLYEHINVAETTQILQNCVLLIEEHHPVEVADEMSTLEDVSCIKTTAESISSDILPITQEHITKKEYNDEVDKSFTNNEEYEIRAHYLSKIEMDDVVVNKEEEIEQHILTNKDSCLNNIPAVEQDNSLSRESENKVNLSQIINITSDIKIPDDKCKTTVEEKVLEDDRNNIKLTTIDDESSCNYKEVVELVTEKNIEKDKSLIEDLQSIEYDKHFILQCDLTDLNTPTVASEMIDSENLELEDTVQYEFEDQTHNVLENISNSSPVILEIIEEKHLKHTEVINKMESLLTELQENVKKYADINITNNTEIIQNLLDEFQMQIIKLKSVNLKETSEILDDLECSVRSVQLLVSENSPPHHVVEASETLQLLISSLKDDIHAIHFDIEVEENDHNLLGKCLKDTETTLLLLNKVSETKGNREDIDKIITGLNSIKDTFKSIKQNFATDEVTLIENGVEIIQTIDIIENQLFCLESDLDKILNIDLTTRDTIVTAIHSVFMNISNMRGTISSIQKHYIYENYGRPSENLLNTIKNIYTLEKLDNRSNWKLLTKHLRNILNHFEDIKFYINLDKTARLPSDASLTKTILNEMKCLLSNIALTNVKELLVPSENEVLLAIKTIDDNLDKINNRSVLEVKEKIPIFKEISSLLIELTDKIKKYYEINIDVVSANDTEVKTMFQKEDQYYLGKILTEENNESETLVETLTFPPNTIPITSLKSTEDSKNVSNKLQTLNSEIWCSNENDTPNGQELIIKNVRPIIDNLIEEATNKILLLRLPNISDIVLEKDAMKESNINQSLPQDFTHKEKNDTFLHVPKTIIGEDNEEILGAICLDNLITEMNIEHLSDDQNLIDNLQSISTPIKNLEQNYEEQASPAEKIKPIDTILKRDSKESELKLRAIEELIPDLCHQDESENLSNLQLNNSEISAIKIEDVHVVNKHQLELDVPIPVDNVNLVSTSDIDLSTPKSEVKECNQENLELKISDIISKNLSQKDEPEIYCKLELASSKDSAQISKLINDVNLNTQDEIKYIKENPYLENSKIITESLSQEDGREKDYKVVLNSSEYSDQASSIIEQDIKSQLTPDEKSKLCEEFNKNVMIPEEKNQNGNFESQSSPTEFNKNHEITSSIEEILIEKEVKGVESIQNENSLKSHNYSENEPHSIDIQPNSNENMDTINTELCKVEIEADKSNTLVDKHIKNNEIHVKKPVSNEKNDIENNHFHKDNFNENIYLENEVLVLKSENDIQEIHASISDKDEVTSETNQKDDENVYDKEVLKVTKKIDKHFEEKEKVSKLINDALQCENLHITDIQKPQVQVGIYSKEVADSFEDENQNSSDHENGCIKGVKSLHIIQPEDIDLHVVNINKELKQSLTNNEDSSNTFETLGNQESLMLINKSLSESEIHVNDDQDYINKILDSSENQEIDTGISSYAIDQNISQNINQNSLYTDAVIENIGEIFEEIKISRPQNTLRLDDEENYIEQDKSQGQLFRSLIDASHEKTRNDETVEIFNNKNEQQFYVPDNFENNNENKTEKIILDEQFIDTQEKNIDNDDMSTAKTTFLHKNTKSKLTKETNDNLKKEKNTFQDDLSSRNSNEKDSEHFLQEGLDVKDSEVLNNIQYRDLDEEEKPNISESEIHQVRVTGQIKLKNDNEGFVNKIKDTQDEVKYVENDKKEKIGSCREINEAETENIIDTHNYHVVTENTGENEMTGTKGDITSEKNGKKETNKKDHKNNLAHTEKKTEKILSEGINIDAESYGVEQNKIQEQQVIVEDKKSDELFIKLAENVNGSECIDKQNRFDIGGFKSQIKDTEKTIGMENIKNPFSDVQNKFDESSFDLESNQNTYIMKDKPQFIDPNVADTNMGFSRPPLYVPKSFDSDNAKAPEINIYNSTSNVFYKAESLVREHQIRSPTAISDINIAEKYRQAEIKQKAKAMSETRSFYSDKRVTSMRDLKKKPVFSTHLTNRTAVEGSRVKLTCSVLSSTAPVLKWFKNGILLEDKQKYKIKFVDGLITMELLNALPSDSGDYSCTVENEHGFVTTSAKLKVYPSFEASPIPPTFTRSIRDIYHRAENELVLECRIRGQPLPTITWLKDNMPISSVDRYEALYLADGLCRLTINSPTIEDSGSYTCRAESSMWSDQITHVVNFTGLENYIGPHLSSIERLRSLHDTRRPHFTNVLNDYKVVKGGTIGLQVEIGGALTRVEWLRGGSSVTEIDKNAQIFVDHGIYTLALSDVTEKHSGVYTCRAWSTHGNVDMNADITVVQPNEMEGKPPVIVSRPAKDILISVGEDINISFRVQGEPRPKVFFMKGIQDITNSQRVCKMTSDDYVKFTLKRSVISDAGTYCILARNVFGCDRTFVTVVVRQRASSENLVSDWVYPNDDCTIITADRNYKTVPGRIPVEPRVVDGGNNWVTLAWPKPDPHAAAPILAYRVDSWLLGKDGGARWIEMGITPRNTFDAFNLKQGEEYHFRVTPRNRYGWGEPVQTSSPIGVGIAGDRPEFVDILPGLLKVLVGETANLSCSLKGKPTPEIVWMKNGHEIEEISRIKSLQRGNVCSLTIKDVGIEDEGRYSCEATNVHGRASTYARMTVITDRQIWEADAKLKRERSADATGDYPPQFTMRLRDRRVQATYPVRLTCQVIGSPAPSMTWFKDGQEIIFDRRKVQYQDEHFHTLEIAPTALDDGGVYEALARNNSGAVSCRCSLVVDKGIRAYVAPEFCCGLEPLYKLNEGEELRVSAIVEAYPSVGVTWYRDGVRLRPSRRAIMTLNRDGQIELALASVTTRDAGVYTCTASNEVGQASTSGKVEIVTEAPREDRKTLPMVICPNVPYSKEPMFIKKPRSTEAQEGDTVIIECEVIGDPTPDVYWLRDFLKPDYYRDANHFKQMAAGPLYRFEIPHAKLDFTGAYSVVARNVHGEAKAIISLQIFAKDLRSNDETHNIRYGRVEVLPRFEKDLTDLLCYDGDAIEFECRVSGNPEPDIRWFHYNEVLPDCPDFESTYEKGTVRLKIKQVTAEDEGTYTCEASNNLGKATSRACLVVYPPGEPNTLSQRLQRPPALASAASTPRSTPRATPARSTSRTPAPRSGSVAHRLRSPTREIAPKFYTYPFNKVVEEGDSVVLQCAVGGLPTPWATWDKDGMIITPTSRISIKEKDEMLRVLQIDEVTIDDVGLYRITLENDFGRAEASARVEVISHKGKFYSRSSSTSPGRFTYRRRTPSLTRQD